MLGKHRLSQSQDEIYFSCRLSILNACFNTKFSEGNKLNTRNGYLHYSHSNYYPHLCGYPNVSVVVPDGHHHVYSYLGNLHRVLNWTVLVPLFMCRDISSSFIFSIFSPVSIEFKYALPCQGIEIRINMKSNTQIETLTIITYSL